MEKITIHNAIPAIVVPLMYIIAHADALIDRLRNSGHH